MFCRIIRLRILTSVEQVEWTYHHPGNPIKLDQDANSITATAITIIFITAPFLKYITTKKDF